MKRGDIIYHYTKNYSTLLSILNTGFLASYAQEKIYERDIAILMVSFSNSSFFTSVNEFNYSKYAIGLSQFWAENNDLQPVAYGHGKGKIQKAVMDTQKLSAIGCTIDLPQLNIIRGQIESKTTDISLINNVDWSKLSSEEIQVVKSSFEEIYINNSEILKYSKPTKVTRTSGKKENSFLDREWRYIPESSETSMPQILFKFDVNSLKINKDWKKWTKPEKPHQKNSTLNFTLRDIRYVITEHKSELVNVLHTLYRRFSKEKVIQAIENGDLLITSNYHLNSQI